MSKSKQQLLDERYLRMARIWAENSYCERRQVGALIVRGDAIISDGYNGTPSGFENICEDTKVAKSNNSSLGATLYVTASPCIECAKLIIQAGIRRVVYSENYRSVDGIELLQKAGIDVAFIELNENQENKD